MYTAQSAIGVRSGLNKRWEIINLATFTVAQLYATFRRIQLTLLSPGSTTPMYFDLFTLVATYSNFSGYVSDLLIALGNVTLPMSPVPLILNSQRAQYSDAFAAGYSVQPVTSSNTIDPLVEITSLPNIRLTNSFRQVDYTYFYNNCLVNINGYFHRIDTDGTNGIMVIDAMKSAVKSGQNQIGLWSFSNVASLTAITITSSMVTQGNPGQATVTLPGNLVNQSVMLVLGGYLVLLDGKALSQVGANDFSIDFTQLDIIDRFFESSNYLDLTSIGLQPASGNPNQIAVADLTTPAAIIAWLQLSQSFFVVVNCPELYSQQLFIKSTGLPYRYISYQAPSSPMVLETGRMPPYWVIYEDQQWSLTVNDNVIGNKLFYTNPTSTLVTTSGANMPGLLKHLSKAYLLEIGRDV